MLWTIIVILINPVAARLFRWESLFRLSANRQLDSRSDRHRRHTRRFEPGRGYIDLRFA